jgi:hypothetical protein
MKAVPSYPYAATGEVTLNGTSPEALTYRASGSGSISLNGTSPSESNYLYTGGGKISLNGAATFPLPTMIALVGTFPAVPAYSWIGSGVVGFVHGYAHAGGETAAGPLYAGSVEADGAWAGEISASPLYAGEIRLREGPGSFNLWGTWIPYRGSGEITLTGSMKAIPSYAYTGSGAVALAGSSAGAASYPYTATGSLSLNGSMAVNPLYRFVMDGSRWLNDEFNDEFTYEYDNGASVGGITIYAA